MRASRVIIALTLLLLLAAAAWLYTPDKPRAALEAQYAPPPSTFLAIEGLRLHLRDTGPRDAPALILLHGFGASLHTWDAWAAALDPTRRVIRLDLPGFALTGPDPTGDYTDPRAIQVLAALMDRLKLPTATLVGNSMGGRIAWRFALDHPDRVDHLVLISPDGFASPGVAYDRTTEVPAMMRALPYVLPTALLRMNLAPSYANPARLTPETVARYRDMLLAPGVRQAILARMAQMRLEDPVPLLRRIHTPTLLIWGTKDAMIPFTNSADYLANLPNATLAPLPGQGHVPHEEAPATALEPLLAFLAR